MRGVICMSVYYVCVCPYFIWSTVKPSLLSFRHNKKTYKIILSLKKEEKKKNAREKVTNSSACLQGHKVSNYGELIS